MRIQIVRDGSAEEVDIDPTLDRFSLLESVRLEEALGPELFERLMGSADSNGQVEVPSSPKIIQAIIWCKLVSIHPDIGLNEFDLDLSEFSEFAVSTEGTSGGKD